MSGSGNTTVPADPSTRSSSAPTEDRVLALVICQCLPEPEREGEVALFDPADGVAHWIIGREVQGGPALVHFFQQLPGEMIDAGPLTGREISHEQLRVTLYGDALRVTNVGNAPVFVDGCAVPKGQSVVIGAGAVIEVFGHSVFVVERRPRTIPHPLRGMLPLPPFGEPCTMGFAGGSPLAWQLREDIAYAADAPGNVLILGETGTGKDVTARAIHARSQRAQGPYKEINCAELTEQLTSARFFGIRKNYPNPGTPESDGYFGEATGGDLFLDEIGCMDKQLQATLLKAMERGYTRVGDTELRRVLCKVIGATNKGESSLAEDVLMRFGFVIRTPALRERPSDIAAIVRKLLLDRASQDAAFAQGFVRHGANGRPYVLVDAALIVDLTRHPLPGNARQVGIILEQAIRAARGLAPLRWPALVPEPPPAKLVPTKDEESQPVAVDDLMSGLDAAARKREEAPAVSIVVQNGSGSPPSPSKEKVLEALDRNLWHYGKAAKALGLSDHQLYRLREKYGLP